MGFHHNILLSLLRCHTIAAAALVSQSDQHIYHRFVADKIRFLEPLRRKRQGTMPYFTVSITIVHANASLSPDRFLVQWAWPSPYPMKPLFPG